MLRTNNLQSWMWNCIFYSVHSAIMLSKGWSIIASYCIEFIPISNALKFS